MPIRLVCTAVGLAFPATGPVTLAARWNGTAWKIQSTPSIPFAYEIDPPAVACPSLSACTAVGGCTNDGPKVTLAERWSATEQSTPHTRIRHRATHARSEFRLLPAVGAPTVSRHDVRPGDCLHSMLAPLAQCRPMHDAVGVPEAGQRVVAAQLRAWVGEEEGAGERQTVEYQL
jgi:hypothetical protein